MLIYSYWCHFSVVWVYNGVRYPNWCNFSLYEFIIEWVIEILALMQLFLFSLSSVSFWSTPWRCLFGLSLYPLSLRALLHHVVVGLSIFTLPWWHIHLDSSSIITPIRWFFTAHNQNNSKVPGQMTNIIIDDSNPYTLQNYQLTFSMIKFVHRGRAPFAALSKVADNQRVKFTVFVNYSNCMTRKKSLLIPSKFNQLELGTHKYNFPNVHSSSESQVFPMQN